MPLSHLKLIDASMLRRERAAATALRSSIAENSPERAVQTLAIDDLPVCISVVHSLLHPSYANIIFIHC